RLAPGRDPEAAAPVGAARHRRHPLAVEPDVGVAVGLPLPSLGRADQVHHRPPEHLGQRAPEELEERQAQAVHPDVVVLPVGARRSERASRPLVAAAELAPADVAVVVDAVRLAPERALPLARLLEKMPPRDRTILRRLEAVVEGGAVVVDRGRQAVGAQAERVRWPGLPGVARGIVAGHQRARGGCARTASSLTSVPQPGPAGRTSEPWLTSGRTVTRSSYHGTRSGSISMMRKFGTTAQKWALIIVARWP